MRRAICSRLPPARQERVLRAWELAGDKTGGYLYSRALLALLSAVFHWIVFQSLGTPAPVALALWVGIISQFLPVVGTYLAGVLPVVLTFLDSPLKAVIVLDRDRRLPADRELPVLAAHHGPHDGAAPGARVRRRARRGGRARRGRRRAGAARGGDGPGVDLSDWGDRHQVVKSDLDRGPPPAGVEALGEDPRSRRASRRRRTCRWPTTSQRRRRERPPRRRGGPRRRRLRRLVAPATPRSGCTHVRRSSRCRRRRWSTPGSRSATGCWPSCAPATTAPRARRRRAGDPRRRRSRRRPTSTTRRRCRSSRTRPDAVVRAGGGPASITPELQRQACRDARDVRDQRLADGGLPRPRPPAAAADRGPPGRRCRRRCRTSVWTAAARRRR